MNDATYTLTYLDSKGNEQKVGGSIDSLTEVTLLRAQYPTCTSLVVQRINHEKPLYTYYLSSQTEQQPTEVRHAVLAFSLTLANDYAAYKARNSVVQYLERCTELMQEHHANDEITLAEYLGVVTEVQRYWTTD